MQYITLRCTRIAPAWLPVSSSYSYIPYIGLAPEAAEAAVASRETADDLAELTPYDAVEKAHPLGSVVDEHPVGWIARHPEQYPVDPRPFCPFRAGPCRLTAHEGHFE
jgi:hypothetical protein